MIKIKEDFDNRDFNLNLAVEVVARLIKMLKIDIFFENFYETVATPTVSKNFQKKCLDSIY